MVTHVTAEHTEVLSAREHLGEGVGKHTAHPVSGSPLPLPGPFPPHFPPPQN